MSSKKSITSTIKHQIIIHIEFESTIKASAGHMFVEYIKIVNEQSISQGIYGFYPVEAYSLLDFLNRKVVQGKIEYDLDTPQEDSFVINVTKNNYDNAVRVRNEWANLSSRPYQAGINDCMSFAFDVTKEIGLNIPTRPSLTSLPTEMLSLLKNIN